MLERREEILSLLRAQEKVTVHELSEHFHCSEVTIRTDLRELESEGRLTSQCVHIYQRRGGGTHL